MDEGCRSRQVFQPLANYSRRRSRYGVARGRDVEYRDGGRTVAEKIRQVQRHEDEILICLPPFVTLPSSGILNRRAMVELAMTNSGGKRFNFCLHLFTLLRRFTDPDFE